MHASTDVEEVQQVEAKRNTDDSSACGAIRGTKEVGEHVQVDERAIAAGEDGRVEGDDAGDDGNQGPFDLGVCNVATVTGGNGRDREGGGGEGAEEEHCEGRWRVWGERAWGFSGCRRSVALGVEVK